MALPNNPQTRKEMYLSNMAGQGTALPSEPHTREEEYLDYIAKNGGGGGTGEGDMTKAVYDDDLAVASAGGIADYVAGAITGKVDKVQGKGLSTNDYDDSAKAIVDNVTTALDAKQPKTLSEPIYVNGIAKFSVETAIDAVNGLAASNKSALLTKADTSQIAAIQDGQNIDSFSDVETALANKVDKVTGKGLSTNDYDNTEKAKVADAFPRSEQAVLGAVNVLVNKAVTQTKNNTTYTVNANKSISLSGIANDTNNITINTMTGAELKALGSKLYLSGGCNGSVYLQIRTDTWQNVASSTGNEVEFSTASLVDATIYTISAVVMNNTDTSGLVFYPQISIAPNQPYSPAMTNKELTDAVEDAKDIKYTSDGTTYTRLKQYVVKPTITFANGVGTATLYKPTGETIGSFAVACANSDKAVAHVNISGTTATVTLTDTSYSSTVPVTIIYFTYKS